jgi:hypothetical protein
VINKNQLVNGVTWHPAGDLTAYRTASDDCNAHQE